jgi:predicted RNase H-like nuclease (RuvC/YqgF family)
MTGKINESNNTLANIEYEIMKLERRVEALQKENTELKEQESQQ